MIGISAPLAFLYGIFVGAIIAYYIEKANHKIHNSYKQALINKLETELKHFKN